MNILNYLFKDNSLHNHYKKSYIKEKVYYDYYPLYKPDELPNGMNEMNEMLTKFCPSMEYIIKLRDYYNSLCFEDYYLITNISHVSGITSIKEENKIINLLKQIYSINLTHQVRIKIKNVEFDIFVFNGLSVVKI